LLPAAAVIMVSSLVWLELSREAQAKVSDWIRINWYTWLEPLTLMPTYFALPMATLRSHFVRGKLALHSEVFTSALVLHLCRNLEIHPLEIVSFSFPEIKKGHDFPLKGV
jgi:hypothetical protein